MSVPENLILEHLRAIRATLDLHTARFDALEQRMGTLEHLVAEIVNSYA